MKHVTQRVNSNGTIRYYFQRRGYPLLRIYGSPETADFQEQVRAANGLSLNGSLTRAEKKAIQKRVRMAATIGRMEFVASRLARAVNNRARNQYKIACEIDTKWIIDTIKKQDGRCAVSGLPFCYRRRLPTKDRRNPRAPSVDRIDSSKPYTKRNCRIVLLAVNVAMNLWGDDLFVAICHATIENKKLTHV
jgi:hypothetical protein